MWARLPAAVLLGEGRPDTREQQKSSLRVNENYMRINEAGINKRMRKILSKQLRWNGVILSVQSRSLFPY